MTRAFGIKNRLYLILSPEDLMIDIGRRRFVFRWYSAEDGITWDPAFHTFIRNWSY